MENNEEKLGFNFSHARFMKNTNATSNSTLGGCYLLVEGKCRKFEGYGMIWDDLDQTRLTRSALGPMCSALLTRSTSSKLHCSSTPDVQRTAFDAQR